MGHHEHKTPEHLHWHEVGFFRLMRCMFHGKLCWITWLMFFYTLALFALCIWSAIAFFCTEYLKDCILFAAVFISSLMLLCFCKLFMWVIMNRCLVLWELEQIHQRLPHPPEHGHHPHPHHPHPHHHEDAPVYPEPEPEEKPMEDENDLQV